MRGGMPELDESGTADAKGELGDDIPAAFGARRRPSRRASVCRIAFSVWQRADSQEVANTAQLSSRVESIGWT